MAILERSLNLAIGTGYTIDLGQKVSSVKLITDSAMTCYVKTFSDTLPAPIAPVASPAPATGALSTWAEMAVSQTLPIGFALPTSLNGSQYDNVRYICVWAVTAGILTVVAQ